MLRSFQGFSLSSDPNACGYSNVNAYGTPAAEILADKAVIDLDAGGFDITTCTNCCGLMKVAAKAALFFTTVYPRYISEISKFPSLRIGREKNKVWFVCRESEKSSAYLHREGGRASEKDRAEGTGGRHSPSQTRSAITVA